MDDEEQFKKGSTDDDDDDDSYVLSDREEEDRSIEEEWTEDMDDEENSDAEWGDPETPEDTESESENERNDERKHLPIFAKDKKELYRHQDEGKKRTVKEEARVYVEAFLVYGKPIPIETRNFLRLDPTLLPEVAYTDRRLAMHVLMNQDGNIYCLYHSRKNRTRVRDGWGRPGEKIHGIPSVRNVSNSKKHSVGETASGYSNCGCTIEDCLLDFFLYMTTTVTGRVNGEEVTETMTPSDILPARARTRMLQLWRSFGLTTRDIYRHGGTEKQHRLDLLKKVVDRSAASSLMMHPKMRFSLSDAVSWLEKMRVIREASYLDLPGYANAIDSAAFELSNLFDTYLVILKQREFVCALATVVMHYRVLKLQARLRDFPPQYDFIFDLMQSAWRLNEDEAAMGAKFERTMLKLYRMEAAMVRLGQKDLPEEYYGHLSPELEVKQEEEETAIPVKSEESKQPLGSEIKMEDDDDLFLATEDDVKKLLTVNDALEPFMLYEWMGQEWVDEEDGMPVDAQVVGHLAVKTEHQDEK
ncbi:hypothetical protein NLJ89_g9946 [Agrocybe chaxingu]|uniref:Uncharacterized protein n=1 Tax=Agrocybe chaxingu TaxID=84603 RepID=A0A9W8JS39_9AGAR|nr:hypothetical protein NLJ89_g9946 [Agrocybe chaxingu]